jgi:hypothetical protein
MKNNMTWLQLYNFLYERANDINSGGSFPWQQPVEVFDFETLGYYPTDFIEFPDKKISLSIDTSTIEFLENGLK